MRWNFIFLGILFWGTTSFLTAHTVYDQDRSQVKIRAGSDTLLRFEKPPISATCHPGLLQFTSVQNPLPGYDKEKFPEYEEEKEEETSSRIIRARAASSGKAECSFYLHGGEKVDVSFLLTPDLLRPSIDFSKERFKEREIPQRGLSDFKKLLTGDFATFTDKTEMQRVRPPHMETKRLPEESSEYAKYLLSYYGSTPGSSLWILDVEIKKPMAYKDLVSLKGLAGEPGFALKFSAALPDPPGKKTLLVGESVRLYISAVPDMDWATLKEGLL